MKVQLLIKNMFVVFEGIDGCGKTSLSKELYCRLEMNGKIFWTKAPMMDALVDYDYDRKLQNELIIRPLLNQNYIVLCDRYHPSEMAYQGHPVSSSSVIEPDLIFYLDIDLKEAVKRIKKRNPKEEIDVDFLANVLDNYRDIAKGQDWIWLDKDWDFGRKVDFCHALIKRFSDVENKVKTKNQGLSDSNTTYSYVIHPKKPE